MTTTKQKQVRLEQPNGDSFQKRVSALCRYYSRMEGATDEQIKEWVRESVLRVLDHAEVAIYRNHGQRASIS